MPSQAALHRWLAAAAAVLAVLAVAARNPHPANERRAVYDATSVTALDVARLIRAGRPDVRVIDLRPDSLFGAYHIPGAERIALDELAGSVWSPEQHVIVYAEYDADAIRAAARLRQQGVKRVLILRGGLVSWIGLIVQPRLPSLAAAATAEEREARREHLELSRYFGGTPYVSPDVEQPTSRASEAAAVARIIRRGC